MLIGIAVAIMIVSVAIGLHKRAWQPAAVETLTLTTRSRATKWVRAGVLFLAEAAGVAASLYITRSLVPPHHNPVILSVLIACANFGGSFAARKNAPLAPQDLFLFFKDGLLWPAALPALAASLKL